MPCRTSNNKSLEIKSMNDHSIIIYYYLKQNSLTLIKMIGNAKTDDFLIDLQNMHIRDMPMSPSENH